MVKTKTTEVNDNVSFYVVFNILNNFKVVKIERNEVSKVLDFKLISVLKGKNVENHIKDM